MKFEIKFEIININAFGNRVCKCQPVCWGLNIKQIYSSTSMWVVHVCSPPIHKSIRQLAISPDHTCNRNIDINMRVTSHTETLLTSVYDYYWKRLHERLSTKLRYSSFALSPCQVSICDPTWLLAIPDHFYLSKKITVTIQRQTLMVQWYFTRS